MNETEIKKIVSQIAKNKLFIETWEPRNSDELEFHDIGVFNSDELDFHYIGVSSLERALIEAFNAGRESAEVK